ncbi:hypothetical protein OAJ30_01780 [Alphaproteobacteria bacterium]|nr:hypothetical protein [Alphaproteobacteria bacterium]
MRLLLFILFLFSMPVHAHQPKLINYSPTIDSPHKVIFPEISKAYYSKLTGQPHYYVINSEDDFLFYTSILSPKINEEPSRFSLEVLDGDQNIVYKVDGLDFEWTAWYEPYARDWYWKGPEIGVESGKEFQTSFTIDAGTYYIKVLNESNTGHYSLAVGEAEFFGSNLWEQILTWTPIILYIGPYMDIVHWQKFDIRAFIPHIALLVLIFIIYFLIKRIFFRKRRYFAK